MKEGLVYIILGCIWVSIVAIVGRRRVISNYLYLLIGITTLCYGIYRFAIGMGAIAIAIFLMIIIMGISIGVLLCGHKKLDENRSLSDDTIPEPSKEEEFLNEIYGTNESKKDNEGIL